MVRAKLAQVIFAVNLQSNYSGTTESVIDDMTNYFIFLEMQETVVSKLYDISKMITYMTVCMAAASVRVTNSATVGYDA